MCIYGRFGPALFLTITSQTRVQTKYFSPLGHCDLLSRCRLWKIQFKLKEVLQDGETRTVSLAAVCQDSQVIYFMYGIIRVARINCSYIKLYKIFMFNWQGLWRYCGCIDDDGADDGVGDAVTVFWAMIPNLIFFVFCVSDLFLVFFLHIQPFVYIQNDSLLPWSAFCRILIALFSSMQYTKTHYTAKISPQK